MRSKSMRSNFITSLGIVFALFFLVNCQRARLEPQTRGGAQPRASDDSGHAGNPDNTGKAGCKASQVKKDKIVKVLFVMDVSGSNYGETGTIPSDPNKQWRAGALRQFINRYIDNRNFYYGLTLFQGTSAKSKINKRGRPGFSNEKEVVAAGYQSFLSTPDGGNTPYKAALKLAKNIIAADLRNNADEQASYAVVMISDGQATDYKSVQDVIPDAWAIKDLAPNRVTLNSVFYASKKVAPSVQKYLKSIANVGEGAFIVANSHQSLKLDEVVRVSQVACQ